MINKERVKFRLESARNQYGKHYISGHVKVVDYQGGGTAGIKFSKDFARFVGESLPNGLGEGRMAYIQVIQISNDQWVVIANYVDNSHAAILWETTQKPAWLNIRRTTSKPEAKPQSNRAKLLAGV